MHTAFMKKLETIRAAATQREQASQDQSKFPSMWTFMSKEDRAFISMAQSRAMSQWWKSLSPEQKMEMCRRIKEGRIRASAERMRKAA